MKNKRSFTSLIVIGLLTTLTTTVYSVTTAHSSDPDVQHQIRESCAASRAFWAGLRC
jgi:hypothetical protein